MTSTRWQRLACFADTGFFYAVIDSGDRWHTECVNLFKQIQEQGRLIVSSHLVVAEAYALIRYRLGSDMAIDWITNLSLWVEIALLDHNSEQRAIEILKTYSDQRFSFTDAVSFAMMEERNIPLALSTDRHFLIYRGNFITLPLQGTILPPL